MLVCRSFGRFMLHSTYIKIHPKFVFTIGPLGIEGPDEKWKKLFSFKMRGLYWRTK